MIKLGVIGMSEGNGHPYSWAAIFNGYNKKHMAECPFSVIPEYLAEKKFPEDSILDAKVTSILTQDRLISEHISLASNIDNVCSSLDELIDGVDAVLLARDDAETHYEYAKPVIEAGLPIYIDKPLALTTKEAERIFALEQYDNQIFTCSALTYSSDLALSQEDRESIGDIKYIDAIIPKYWETYSIHLLEPIINIIGYERAVVDTVVKKYGDSSTVVFEFDDGIILSVKTLGKTSAPLRITFCGEDGCKDLVVKQSAYDFFKLALQHFIGICLKEKSVSPRELVLKSVELIEKGLK